MESPQSINLGRAADAMARRVDSRIASTGEITFPAVPGLVDEFTEKCIGVFAGLGRVFTDSERDHLRSVLGGQLSEAFARSHRSSIIVTYRSPVAEALNYEVTFRAPTIEQTYADWVATRKPPLFGVEPDARVLDMSVETAVPAASPVLEIGAGTGRNALALARRGHPVDVVEITESFADIIRQTAQQDSLAVRVINRDVFETDDDLRRDYSMIVLSEVVSDFRTVDQLRRLFEIAARCLAPGGRLVFNVFLTNPGFLPEDASRQFGQQAYTCFFTRAELASAVEGLPLYLVADDCVYEYEKDHLPAGAWPPTGWYANWVSGHDVFDLDREHCPIDMRWLVYRKNEPTDR